MLSISRVIPTRAATASTVGPVIVSTGLSVCGSTAATYSMETGMTDYLNIVRKAAGLPPVNG